MLDIISTLFPAPSLEEVIASVNEDTPHHDVRDIDDILSSYPAHTFFEPVDFVKYPWFTKRVNPKEPPALPSQPAVPLKSRLDVLQVDSDLWKVLSKALEAHVRRAQEGFGPINIPPAVVENPVVQLLGRTTVKPLELHGVERKSPADLLDPPTPPCVITPVDFPQVSMSSPGPSTSLPPAQHGLLWCDSYLAKNAPHPVATWVAGVQAVPQVRVPSPAQNLPPYYHLPTSSGTSLNRSAPKQNPTAPKRPPSRQTKPVHPSPLHENYVARQPIPSPATPPATYSFIAQQPQGTSTEGIPAQTQRMHGFLRYSAPSGMPASFGSLPAVQTEVRQQMPLPRRITKVPGPVSSNPRTSFVTAPAVAAQSQACKGYYPPPVMARYNATPVLSSVYQQDHVSIAPHQGNAAVPSQATNPLSSSKRRALPVENEDLPPSKKARMATTMRTGVPAVYRPPQSHPNRQGWPIRVR